MYITAIHLDIFIFTFMDLTLVYTFFILSIYLSINQSIYKYNYLSIYLSICDGVTSCVRTVTP